MIDGETAPATIMEQKEKEKKTEKVLKIESVSCGKVITT